VAGVDIIRSAERSLLLINSSLWIRRNEGATNKDIAGEMIKTGKIINLILLQQLIQFAKFLS
jgi:hypothetical protein